MIEVYTLPQIQMGLLKNYGDFSAPICGMKNSKLFEDHSDFEHKSWCFIEYPPQRVAHLYNNWKKCFPDLKMNASVQQAYEQGLSLLEICTGDYDNPRYIPVVRDLDIEALKKQGHINYCAFHHPFIARKKTGEKKRKKNASAHITKRGDSL